MGETRLPETKYALGKTVWLVDKSTITKHIIREIIYTIHTYTGRSNKSSYKYILSGQTGSYGAVNEENLYGDESSAIESVYGNIKQRIKDRTVD